MPREPMEAKEYIADLMRRARKAQKVAEHYTQAQADQLAFAICYEVANDPAIVESWAKLALEETRLGDYASKLAKVRSKCRQMFYDVKNIKTVGVTEEIPEKGLMRISKPVGVIGSLVPSTQPEMHPMIQAVNAMKARDAIIFAPHPRGKKTSTLACNVMRSILKRYGAPEDLILCIEEPTIQLTDELMHQCDLVIATGGQPMVRAGRPAFGVGAGNACITVDKTADLADAAVKIRNSKTFDLAAGCSCDNSVIIEDEVYESMLRELRKVGGHLLNAEEKEKLRRAIWPEWPKNHVINRDVVASPVSHIAKIAGIQIPEQTSFLMVEEELTGAKTPFAGEKMTVTMAVYRFHGIDDAIRIVNENHAYSGAGHSCGIYSTDEQNILTYALNTYTTRVTINQPNALTNTGSWTSGLPFTSSLGCGTWGGNICSENISLKHYMNNTWMIREIPNFQPTDEELWSGFTAGKAIQ